MLKTLIKIYLLSQNLLLGILSEEIDSLSVMTLNKYVQTVQSSRSS